MHMQDIHGENTYIMNAETLTMQYWTRYFEDTYNCYYYVNNSNGRSQWDYPSSPYDIVCDTNSVGDDEIVERGDILKENLEYAENSVSNTSNHFRCVSAPKDNKQKQKVGKLTSDKVDKSSEPFSDHSDSLETTARINRNYVQMARLYKIYRPYSLSETNFKCLKCVLCNDREPVDVFFPCEHRCVCRPCIAKEQICDDASFETNLNGYCNCSLCAEVIKKILPYENGQEIEKYWTWVYEQKIHLPDGFLRNFRHSAAVIEAVYVNNPQGSHTTNESTMCTLS